MPRVKHLPVGDTLSDVIRQEGVKGEVGGGEEGLLAGGAQKHGVVEHLQGGKGSKVVVRGYSRINVHAIFILWLKAKQYLPNKCRVVSIV